ncbi:MAG: hypothetical protein JWQ27_769 [Ferruginibacter sp.]|nr:hypothetical protein [Ferruginibacter sp.]
MFFSLMKRTTPTFGRSKGCGMKAKNCLSWRKENKFYQMCDTQLLCDLPANCKARHLFFCFLSRNKCLTRKTKRAIPVNFLNAFFPMPGRSALY